MANIFSPENRMRKIGVPRKPTIIGIFAVFISRTHFVRNGAFLKQLPCLLKKRFFKIKVSTWWIGMFLPLVFMPDGVGAFFRKSRNNIFFRFVANSFVQCPVLPKSREVSQSDPWSSCGKVRKSQFLSQFYFRFRDTEFFFRNRTRKRSHQLLI